MFDYILNHNPKLERITDPAQRRQILFDDLFLIVFKRTSRALLHHDHVVLAMLLVQVKLRGAEDLSDVLEFLLESGEGVKALGDSPTFSFLSLDQQERLNSYAKHALFQPVPSHMRSNESEWISFLESPSPEQCPPSPWEPSSREYLTYLSD